jgi:O-methyltransferase
MRFKSLERAIKLFLPPILTEPIRRRRRARIDQPYDNIPDRAFYDGVFSPWLGYGEFGALFARMRPHTRVSAERAWVLYSLARQALALDGVFYEAGVFRGGTALMLAELLRTAGGCHELHLFDTFAGMPTTDARRDLHKAGDFSNTSLDTVRASVGADEFIHYHPGLVPETFAGREADRIAFAHVDLDIHRSILDSCEFIYPRLLPGGFIVFDDYGFMSCPGARQAVDEFFAARPEVPLVLPTGQAVVFRGFGA